jgi:urea carboxylase-associated protein 2
MVKEKIMSVKVLWEDFISGGSHGSFVMKRDTILKVTDIVGNGNLVALFYNMDNKLERYNMADTLKAQHTFFLSKGNVCYSDMGRILCSIVDSSCTWHDTISGMSNHETITTKYGALNYQKAHNDMHRNAQDSVLIELSKWGLDRRDLIANVNFFSKVTANEQGILSFVPDNSKPGDFVELRFEMNVLVVLASSQHVLDPSPRYSPNPFALTSLKCSSAGPYDLCRNSCPENGRGFYNTELIFK